MMILSSEWDDRAMCGNDEREREREVVSLFFFSFFFLIFSFFGRIEKKKNRPKEIANTDRDAFFTTTNLFLPRTILL